MMRSLWTAASGMKSQQLYVDSIANNLSNVNTMGYKKETIEFKSLFYDTLIESGVNEGGDSTPVSLQIGHGVRAAASVKNFSSGSVQTTGNPLDFMVNGNGFFVAQDANGDQVYTRDGSFKISIVDDAIRLTTTEGYSVLDVNGEPIEFDNTFLPDNLSVDSLGNMFYTTNEGTEDLGIRLGIVQFQNVAGLDAVGNGYYKTSAVSGQPLLEADEDDLSQSTITQGAIEASNVQIVDEMVKMIIAQRAYELNSKAIQTSDEMLSLANNLKR